MRQDAEQMRIDPLAEGRKRPSADQAVEPVFAKRPTALAEPEPAGRLGVPEAWSIEFDIPIDARRAPIGKHGKVQATLLGLLGGDLEAPGRAVLDQGPANLESRNVVEAERIGGEKGDDQAIPIEQGPAERGRVVGLLGLIHQLQTERERAL